MNSKSLQQIVYEEIGTSMFNSGLDWIEKCCDALIIMLSEYSKFPIKIVINEETTNSERYDSAYLDTKNEVTIIYIGLGLIINIAKGIVNFDSEKISNMLSNYSNHYKGKGYSSLALNCIFIASLFVFINHELAHTILGHSRQNDPKISKEQEICADCIAGQLMESIYTSLADTIRASNYNISNIDPVVDALFTIGITYGAWKIESKYPDRTSTSHPDIRIRPVLIVGSFIIAVGDKKNMQRMLDNLGHLYKLLYDMKVDDFDKFYHKYILLCEPCCRQICEITSSQGKTIIPLSTPTT